MEENGLFRRMCKEAIEELSSGKKGWKDVETNTLIMACFGILTNHLTHKITTPLWFFAGAVAAGVISYIISLVLGG